MERTTLINALDSAQRAIKSAHRPSKVDRTNMMGALSDLRDSLMRSSAPVTEEEYVAVRRAMFKATRLVFDGVAP